MADEKQRSFPDMPQNQWWRLRQLFRNKLPDTLNVAYIRDILGIEEKAAQNIYRNLGMFGFIDKDGKTLDRANHWRVDDQYADVCKEIMVEIYPRGLLDAPVETVDRNYLVNWFVRNTRVGESAAHKNAAVFEWLREADLTKGKDGKPQAAPKAQTKKLKPAKPAIAAATVDTSTITTPTLEPTAPVPVRAEKPILNEKMTHAPSIHIDIQLHISPEASETQIEAIFAAIEKHLYRPNNNGG